MIVDPPDSHIVGIQCLRIRPKILGTLALSETWDVHGTVPIPLFLPTTLGNLPRWLVAQHED